MISQKVRVCNKLGLHARAASQFVAVAKEFGAAVKVTSPTNTANGKSIMNMMLLQASNGTEIEIEATGEDEDLAIKTLVRLVEARFGEAE